MIEMDDKKLHEAIRKAKAKLAHAKRTVLKAEQKVEQYTKHNPKKALGIAAAAGAVLAGVAVALAMRRRK